MASAIAATYPLEHFVSHSRCHHLTTTHIYRYLQFVDSQKTFHYSAPVTAKSVAGIATPDESNRHITPLRLCVLSTAIPTLWWLGEAAFGWAGVIRFRWLQPCPVHLHELQPHGRGLKT